MDVDDDEDDIAAGDADRVMGRKASFQDLCRSIRQNKPSMTVVDVYENSDYSGDLGRALQENTHVHTLKLRLSCLVKFGRFHFDLQSYIRTSTSLRSVCFKSWWCDLHEHESVYNDSSRVSQSLLEAVASNPNIQELVIGHSVHSKSLAWFLRQDVPSLKSLTFYLCAKELDGQHVAEAFAQNRSIENLTILERSDAEMVQVLFKHSSMCFREIHLSCGEMGKRFSFDCFETLQSSSCLVIFTMDWCVYSRGDLMYAFLKTLSECPALEELSLTRFTCAPQAASALHEYARGFDSSKCTVQALRKLTLLDCNGRNVPQLNNLANSIFSNPASASLEHLALSGTARIGLWQYLNANVATTRLSSLSMSFFHDDVDNMFDSMIECVPKLTHMRVLDVDYPWSAEARSRFIQAVYRNGSLHTVTLSLIFNARYPEHSKSNFGARHLTKLKRIGQRNQMIPKLLTAAAAAAPSTGKTKTQTHREKQRLVPSLFHSAMEAPRTAPTNVLMGLRTLSKLEPLSTASIRNAVTGGDSGGKPNRHKKQRVA